MDETQILERRFSTHLTTLVYERLALYLAHPLGGVASKELSWRCKFYSKILIYVMLGREPHYESFEDSPDRDIEVLYQDGIYLYTNWKELGLDRAVFRCCQLLNCFVARMPIHKGDADNIARVDLCYCEYDIRHFLRRINQKTLKPSKKKRRYKKKSRKLSHKLAVMY